MEQFEVDYRVSKRRYKQLADICMQYYELIWIAQDYSISGGSLIDSIMQNNKRTDSKVEWLTALQSLASSWADIIKSAAFLAGGKKHQETIIRAVSAYMPYDEVYSNLGLSCERREFYEMLRKFFWWMDHLSRK